jgi:hypothetical protein
MGTVGSLEMKKIMDGGTVSSEMKKSTKEEARSLEMKNLRLGL